MTPRPIPFAMIVRCLPHRTPRPSPLRTYEVTRVLAGSRQTLTIIAHDGREAVTNARAVWDGPVLPNSRES